MGGRAGGGGAGFGSRSGGYTDASMRGYSKALAKAMKDREDEIRGLPYENLSIFDDNGKELFKNKGTATRVFSDAKLEANHIVTHNHPAQISAKNKNERADGGGSLSKQDILGSIRTNAKEIRAVTKKYVYTLKRPSTGWHQGGWEGNKFYSNNAYAYKKAKSIVDKRVKDYYKSAGGKGTSAGRRVSATYWHLVNKEFAKIQGYTYMKVKVK